MLGFYKHLLFNFLERNSCPRQKKGKNIKEKHIFCPAKNDIITKEMNQLGYIRGVESF